MADGYDTLQLVGRHVPDDASGPFENMQQALHAGHDTLNPVTGMYEIGAMVDGAFVPIMVEKASLVFDKIDVAKKNAPPPDADEPATTGPLAGEASNPDAQAQPQAQPQTEQPQPEQPQG